MRTLLKLFLVSGFLIYLFLGNGLWPSTARTAWGILDQAVGRQIMTAALRLHKQTFTRDMGDVIWSWVWNTRDPYEQEVMRRYMELTGYPIR